MNSCLLKRGKRSKKHILFERPESLNANIKNKVQKTKI